jgi:hypothetical protein
MPEMTEQMWGIAHTLAADLALNRVSKNLVQQTAEYLRSRPEADLEDYLLRLERLGDAFAGGKSGQLERTDLRRALRRVGWPRDDRAVLTLGWVVRLIDYYARRPAEAADRSRLQFVNLHPGDSVKGTVRERSQQEKRMWIAVAPGQWGTAGFHPAVDVGDEVQVSVRRVVSPIDFEVNLTDAPEQRRAQPVQAKSPAASGQRRTQPSPPPESPAGEDRISQSAQSVLETIRRKQLEQPKRGRKRGR